MKRNHSHASTIATLAEQIHSNGRLYPAVALASSTIVTLPAAAYLLRGQSLALVLLVGLVPVLPLVLAAVAFISIYMVASLLATIVVATRIAVGKGDPSASLDDLFEWIANSLIAFLTLTPIKLAPRQDEPRTQRTEVAPLPARPLSARKQDEPFFWRIVQDQAVERPRGARKGVPLPDDPITQPIATVGRHARPAASSAESAAETRIPEMSR